MMRMRTYTNGGYGVKGIDPAGGTMTLPLRLVLTPGTPMDAVTKGYVDNAASSFTGSTVLGTFNSARLPGWSGSDISSAGGVFTLSATGVGAGTYSKVTVDDRGRVTAGGSLTTADIPDLSWSKIIGKPSTLAGYGITDVVSLNGGVMTGALTLGASVTGSTQLATKAYVDITIGNSGSSPFVVGDIVYKSTAVTPSGFLRCNGGAVSKTTYAGLYSVVGDTQSYYHRQPGYGRPWEQMYDIGMNPTTDFPTTWSDNSGSGAYLNYYYERGSAVMTKNKVYYLGGRVNSTYLANIGSGNLNADGSLSGLLHVGNLPLNIAGCKAIISKNKVYLLGGEVDGVVSGTVLIGDMDTSGNLPILPTGWYYGANIPTPTTGGQAAIIGDRMYVFGGGYSNKVYHTILNTSGAMTTSWTESGSLPTNMPDSTIAVLRNRVYLIGNSSVIGCYVNPDNSLSGWTTYTPPPFANSGQGFVTRDKVYILGDGLASWASSAINADGSLSTWVTGTLPFSKSGTAIVFNVYYMYLFGGVTDGGYGGGSGGVFTIKKGTLLTGYSDYSTFYTADLVTTATVSATMFNLPDLTTKDKPGSYSYIKY